ncbi:MAG: sensor domain-containing diguanylate cyclase [Candidatus Eisenbacteria sp.]|nr:sensor domain-containing diguanylate cyclase [Candidatus Eisenbacteria bacterium]
MEKLEFFRVLDNLYDAVWFLDSERHITHWNAGAEKLTGYTADEMLGADCKEKALAHLSKDGVDLCDSICPLLDTDNLRDIREVQVYLRHKEGHLVPAQARMVPLRDANGHITGAAEIFSNRSVGDEIEKRLEDLERLARLDILTRLPNRRYIEEEVTSHLAELERFDRYFGIMMIDLDGFAKMNDRFGTESGDDVLRMIARTWFLAARPFDTVARWEDDSFAVVGVHLDREGLRAMAERFVMLLSNLLKPWDRSALGVGASVGATMVRRGDTTESVLLRAEKALERAKLGGGGQLVVEE